MSLYHELKRRNVFRVAIAYLAGSWLLVEVAETIFPLFGFDDTPARILVIVLAIGFPLFLLFSWVFEFTHEGLKREKDIKREQSIGPKTGKRLDRVIIVLLALALGYFAFDKFVLDPSRDTELVQVTTEAVTGKATESWKAEIADKSIAVLPFVNMSDDPGNEYFSDGISEELLNALVRVEGLRVVSRTSSFAFKGKDISIPSIAKQLNVDHVLEGSVRKAGNTVRVTTQLVDVHTDSRLWSETYDRTLDDIFAIQDEIAQSVVMKLRSALLGEEELPRVGGTRDFQAYEHYLQGRHFWRRRNADDLLHAAHLLERAVEIDPDYADAWSALGAVYVVIPSYLHMEQDPYTEKAVMAARCALELDSMQAEAYAVMASYYGDQNLWSDAVQNIEKAIELGSQNATAHHWAYLIYISLGWVGEAHREIEKAYRLDPLNAAIAASLGWSYSVLGDYENAITALETADELGWGTYASLYIALNHALKGDTKTAAELYAEISESREFSHFDWTPMFLAALQDHRHVDQFAEQMIKMVEEGEAHGFSVFPMLVLLGSEKFKTVLVNRNYIWALWYRDASAIRQTQTFWNLVDELKLIDYWRETDHWPDMCEPISDENISCD